MSDPIVLRVQPGYEAARALTEIKEIALDSPGDRRLELRYGKHSMLLGPEWLFDPDELCLASLSKFGEVESS